jgi:hypothetical protein
MKHPHPVPYYADLYQIPLVSMYRYSKRGVNIDDPKELLDHILLQDGRREVNTRNLRTMVPKGYKEPAKAVARKQQLAHTRAGRVVKPVVRSVPFRKPTQPPVQPDDKKPAKKAPKTPRSDSERESTTIDTLNGFQRELARLEEETNNCYQSYLDTEDPMEKATYWKLWQSMLETWGKLAKIAPDAEKIAGNVVTKSDLEATWMRTFKEIRTMLEAVPRRMATHAAFAELNPVDVEQAWIEETQRLMEALASGDFLKAEQEKKEAA